MPTRRNSDQWMAEGDCARFDFIPIKDWVFQ